MSEEPTPELTKALSAVQAELPMIPKNKKATVKSEKANYSYKYADLADISPKVMPLLAKNGLAWTSLPTLTEDGKFVLVYELLHVSGEKKGGRYPLPDPLRATPQQVGSAITYARRYAFTAATGVVADEDEDGHISTLGHHPYDDQGQPPSAEQPPPPPVPQELQAARGRVWEASRRVLAAGTDSARQSFITRALNDRGLSGMEVVDLTALAVEWEAATPGVSAEEPPL